MKDHIGIMMSNTGPVCGLVRDTCTARKCRCDREGDIPLPHYSIQCQTQGVSVENLMDIEELHGCMPVHDLAKTEAWLKARENEGYEFMKCVLVNLEGHVIWLRGDPEAWSWITDY